MTLLFGVASKDSGGNSFPAMRQRIEGLFQMKAQVLQNLTGAIRCGLICDGGSILGKVVTSDYFLVYLGLLEKPMDHWDKGSPLDYPDNTAQYLLKRFRERGVKFLDNVFGHYVVVLCDINRSKLMLATDPSGFGRLFFRTDRHQTVFGTNLVSLSGAFRNGLQIDRSLENFLLGYEFLPGNRTLLDNVTCLTQGTLLEFSQGVLQSHHINRPHLNYTSDVEVREDRDETTIIQRLYNRFMLALEQQSPSTDRVAVLLGGVDSALVAACLKRLGKEVKTYSFHFEDSRFNQPHTDQLASFLGTKHTWVSITPEIILDGLKHYSLRFNQVSSQPHYLIQTAHACQVIREQGYLHCFTGDGCDETFLGYPSVHSRAKLFLRFGVLPHGIVKVLLYLLRCPLLEKHLGHTYRLARNVITVSGRRMPVRGHITSRVFDELSLERLRVGHSPGQEMKVEDILVKLASGLEELSPLRLAYHGKAAPRLNRNKKEGSSYCAGITIQSPYMHPAMIKMASSFPESLLRPREKAKSSVAGKYILTKMAEENKLLPKEVIYQKKASPVAAPVDQWYMGPLRESILTSLSTLPFEYSREYVDYLLRPKLSEQLFRQHVSIGYYAFNAICLLVTYANFAKYASTTPSE